MDGCDLPQLSTSKTLSKMLRNLDKSWKVSTKISIISKNHGNLNLSWWSWLVSMISIKVSTQPSLGCKSLNFKNLNLEKKSWSRHDGHSRRFSKVGHETKDILDLDLDWSRLLRPPTLVFHHSITLSNVITTQKWKGCITVFHKLFKTFLKCHKIIWWISCLKIHHS